MRADDQAGGTTLNCCKRRPPLGLALTATEPCKLMAGGTKPVVEVLPVLFCQQFGWRHYGSLHATRHRAQARRRRNNRLAGTDIDLDQAHHGMW